MIIYFKRFSYPCHLRVKPKYKHEPEIFFDLFSLCEQKFWLSGFFPIIWKKKVFVYELNKCTLERSFEINDIRAEKN
mgnify:CR=1 FL=1